MLAAVEDVRVGDGTAGDEERVSGCEGGVEGGDYGDGLGEVGVPVWVAFEAAATVDAERGGWGEVDEEEEEGGDEEGEGEGEVHCGCV